MKCKEINTWSELFEKRYYLDLSESEFNFIMLSLDSCYKWYKDSDANKHLASEMKNLFAKLRQQFIDDN